MSVQNTSSSTPTMNNNATSAVAAVTKRQQQQGNITKSTSKKKAQPMSLTDFTGDKKAGTTTENSLSWAEDNDQDERDRLLKEQHTAAGGSSTHKLYGRKVGAMTDFRSAAAEQLTTIVPADMNSPYLAHVGNLPHTLTEDQLKDAFAQHFKVVSCKLIKTGMQKSTFGYVEVDTREELQALILQTGRHIQGRIMRADVATEQQIERYIREQRSSMSRKNGGGSNSLNRDCLGQAQQPQRPQLLRAEVSAETAETKHHPDVVRNLDRGVFGSTTQQPLHNYQPAFAASAAAVTKEVTLNFRSQSVCAQPVYTSTLSTPQQQDLSATATTTSATTVVESWRRNSDPVSPTPVAPADAATADTGREDDHEEEAGVECAKPTAAPQTARSSSPTATPTKKKQKPSSSAAVTVSQPKKSASVTTAPIAVGGMFAALGKRTKQPAAAKNLVSCSVQKPAKLKTADDEQKKSSADVHPAGAAQPQPEPQHDSSAKATKSRLPKTVAPPPAVSSPLMVPPTPTTSAVTPGVASSTSSSFQGFDIKSDPQIRALAQMSWADLVDEGEEGDEAAEEKKWKDSEKKVERVSEDEQQDAEELSGVGVGEEGELDPQSSNSSRSDENPGVTSFVSITTPFDEVSGTSVFPCPTAPSSSSSAGGGEDEDEGAPPREDRTPDCEGDEEEQDEDDASGSTCEKNNNHRNEEVCGSLKELNTLEVVTMDGGVKEEQDTTIEEELSQQNEETTPERRDFSALIRGGGQQQEAGGGTTSFRTTTAAQRSHSNNNCWASSSSPSWSRSQQQPQPQLHPYPNHQQSRHNRQQHPQQPHVPAPRSDQHHQLQQQQLYRWQQPQAQAQQRGFVHSPLGPHEYYSSSSRGPSSSRSSAAGRADPATALTPSTASSSPPPRLPPLIHSELQQYLMPFFPYNDLALHGDLPTAEALFGNGGSSHHRSFPSSTTKLFLGHVWSRVPTGVIQWLLNTFGPVKLHQQQQHNNSGGSQQQLQRRQPTVAFEPELHFSPEGFFRGCLHVYVTTTTATAATDVLHPQSLISALHKRVLFDNRGVWYADTAEKMVIMDEYCARVKSMSLEERHNKLQGLPCTPLTCELARAR